VCLLLYGLGTIRATVAVDRNIRTFLGKSYYYRFPMPDNASVMRAFFLCNLVMMLFTIRE